MTYTRNTRNTQHTHHTHNIKQITANNTHTHTTAHAVLQEYTTEVHVRLDKTFALSYDPAFQLSAFTVAEPVEEVEEAGVPTASCWQTCTAILLCRMGEREALLEHERRLQVRRQAQQAHGCTLLRHTPTHRESTRHPKAHETRRTTRRSPPHRTCNSTHPRTSSPTSSRRCA